MANRKVQVGDLYYHKVARSLFVVTGPVLGDELISWSLHNGDGIDRTMFMCSDESKRDNWVYLTRPGPDFKVKLNSLWYTLGCRDLFRVVRYNDNTEAGPDSWEMLGGITGKTLYMHHSHRVQGEWLLVGAETTPDPDPVVRRSRYHRNPVI